MRTRPTSPASVRDRRCSLSGFTLIELMVVIGIIAVLIALVLPAIGNAQKQARVTATKATLSVLETGLEQFRADTTIGGSYPPSVYAEMPSPHADNTRLYVGGASLLVWGLAGADLLGTPGFRDLDGDGFADNDIGRDERGGVGGTPPPMLYHINPATNIPTYTRSGPFVDISKMKFPELTAAGFEIPASNGAIIYSQCFLDTFDQPILYYAANSGQPWLAWDSAHDDLTPGRGIYNLHDNVNITGDLDTAPGINLGGGPLFDVSQQPFHYMADLGADFMNGLPADSGQKCFARTVWNPNVTAVPGGRPHQVDSYILISAGPDGVFGNADDIANFEVNK